MTYSGMNWRIFLKESALTLPILEGVKKFNVTLSHLVSMNGGITSGNDNYFFVNADTINRFKIPTKYLIPVLVSQKKLTTLGINEDDTNLYLFSCYEHPSEVGFSQASYYINYGIEIGVNKNQSLKSMWYCVTGEKSLLLIPRTTYNNFGVFYNTPQHLIDNWACGITSAYSWFLFGYLNSIVNRFMMEVLGNSSRGGGVRTFSLGMLGQLPIIFTQEIVKEYNQTFPKSEYEQEFLQLPVRGINEINVSELELRIDAFFIKHLGIDVSSHIYKELAKIVNIRIHKSQS